MHIHTCLLAVVLAVALSLSAAQTAVTSGIALPEDMEEEQTGVNFGDEYAQDEPSAGMPSAVEVEGYTYIGVLEIPALGLRLPVMDDWDYTRLKIAPCRYQGSVGQGNLVLLAHNYETHFGRLRELQPGDEIDFTDTAGHVHRYQVKEGLIVDPADVHKVTANGCPLTLFTCTPGGEMRYSVRCTEITE